MGGYGTATGATSATDGASNTEKTVNCLTHGVGAGCIGGVDISTYAAGFCRAYSVDAQGNSPCQSGHTCYDDWFLPALSGVPGSPSNATSQLGCLLSHRFAIGGFANDNYWSSTESSGLPTQEAFFWTSSMAFCITTRRVTSFGLGVSGLLLRNRTSRLFCLKSKLHCSGLGREVLMREDQLLLRLILFLPMECWAPLLESLDRGLWIIHLPHSRP